jgi:hypothetical protein
MRTSWEIVNSCKRCGTPLQIIISNYSLQSPPLLVYDLSLSALHILQTLHFQNKWTLVSSQASACFRMPHSLGIVCPLGVQIISHNEVAYLVFPMPPPINMKLTTERWETANNKPFEPIIIYHQSKTIVKTFQCILRIKTSCA